MKSRFTQEEKAGIISQYQNGSSAAAVCEEHGIASSTLYSWIREQKSTGGSGGAWGTKPGEMLKKRYADLKRHADKMEQKLKIIEELQLQDQIPLEDKLILFEELREQYSAGVLCEALHISKGTYHNRILHFKDPMCYKEHRESIKGQIRQIFDESEQRFGADKITAVLIQRKVHTSKKMVLKLMKEMGLQSIGVHAKRLARKTAVTENILQQAFDPSAPNEVWVGDITQYKVLRQTYYICAILDLYSRRVIEYKVSQNETTQLVTSTFKAAFEKRGRPSGLLFHSDQGTQYTAMTFRKLLEECGVRQSFSNSGRPYDNAVVESFFAILKREELYRRIYRSERDFRESVDTFMEYYNSKRPHRYNGYRTPVEKEEAYTERVRQQ